MGYVDAHIHLADEAYSGRIEALIEDAVKHGVEHLLSNSMDYDSSVETIAFAKRYNGRVLAAVGVHPWTVTNKDDTKLDQFEELVETNRKHIIAIGEIGLDGQYSSDKEKKKRQHEVFELLLGLAERAGLPAIVHSRMALDEVLESLSSFKPPKVLLHWYSGPAEKLGEIGDRGYMISVGPPLLYSKRISDIARNADLGIMLTETDGPVPYHGPFEGKMTQPSFVIDVVRKLAEIKSLSIDKVGEAIWNNFKALVPTVGQDTV